MIRGDQEVVSRFALAIELWMPLIAIGERMGGFAFGTQRHSNEAKLKHFLNKPSVGVLLPDENSAAMYGEISAKLKQLGTLIPTNYIWIAALALQHDLMLDTRDRHFEYVPGLKLVPSTC
jgi:predicted nucleic acid-binding protein